ncbi:MAG: hypothetical protein MI924_07805 [Chloroflexales bacterium]|nr:hypothetical protein [Chloroflexales bacterium]
MSKRRIFLYLCALLLAIALSFVAYFALQKEPLGKALDRLEAGGYSGVVLVANGDGAVIDQSHHAAKRDQ